MNQHTQTSWARPIEDTKRGFARSLRDTIIDHEGRQIWPIMDSNGDSDTPEAEANYRLIYAAPDLLAALEAIRDRTFVDAEGPELRAQNEFNHRLALAAIAKATGAKGGGE